MECNNNHRQTVEGICKSNKMALNSLLLLDNCCHGSSNQNLLNQKNSSTTNTNALIASHHSLPPTHAATATTLMNNSNGNKLTLNCSGASMSTITSSVVATTTTTSAAAAAAAAAVAAIKSSSSLTVTPQTPSSSLSSSSTPKMGSRRIFTPQFKLQVLESYRNDNDCKGNQRATARKYGIHRRQIQKWLQCENNLRSIIANNPQNVRNNALKSIPKATAPILSQTSTNSRHRGVAGANTEKNGATYSCFTLTNVKSYKASNSVGSTIITTTTTKSLSSSSSLSSSFGDFTCGSNATANETNKTLSGNLNFYFDNSHMGSIYAGNNTATSDDAPIDLSCGSHQTVKVKMESVARPIPLHPSASNYKIPFYNYGALAQQPTSISPAIAATSSCSSPRLIDISNSVVKAESLTPIDPIDLRISNVSHKRKLSTDNSNCSDDNKKPIKLFRPYLEGNFDSDDSEPKDDAQKFPVVWSNAYNFYPDHPLRQPSQPSDYHPFLMTHLASVVSAPSSPPASYFSAIADPHALAIPISTPPSGASSTLSSPNDSGLVMSTSFPTLLPPSQASPVSGYDSSTSSIYSFNDNEVDLSQGNSPPYTSSHYDAPSPLSSATMSPSVETKVPLSASSSSFLHDLKFKLHALDCYYNDVDCKRNEKLVANKLKINCKIVEKWLRQESDLRHQQKQYHLQILV